MDTSNGFHGAGKHPCFQGTEDVFEESSELLRYDGLPLTDSPLDNYLSKR